MGQPEVGAASNAAATARALAENAKRLGLTWTRRIATVVDPDTPTAIFDGDQVPLRMTSMLSIALLAGDRVYVDIIPPSGLFIVGRVGVVVGSTPGVRARVTGQAVTSGAVTTLVWDVVDETVGTIMIGPPSTLCTIPEDGIWALHVQISSAAAVNAVRNLLQILMTVQTITGQPTQPARSVYVNGETIVSVSLTTRCNAGDQFSVQMFQNTAVSPATVTAWLSCYKVAP